MLVASGIVESQNSGSSNQDQQRSGGPITRSQLVQRLLNAGPNLPQFITELITMQAVVVAGTEAAGFGIEPAADGGFNLQTIAHIRPDNSSPETRAAAINAFQEIVRPCILQNKNGAIEIGSPDESIEPQFCLVTLLRSEGQLVAVSAVITRCRDLERAQQRLISMELVAGYFELFTLRRTAEQSRSVAQSHQHVLQLATTVATADGFVAAAMGLCNELATRTGAARVSIGWLKGNRIKLKAMSHTEQFDRKQELSVQIEKTMEECIDQEEIVQYDSDGKSSDNVTRDAQALSRMEGGTSVLSLPLRRGGDIHGVLTLEFAPGHKLGPQAATGLAVAAELLAPQLYDRYQNDRWLITKALISTRETAKLAIGPKHMLAKAIILLVIGLGLFLTFYTPMYRVKAAFAFAPLEERTIAAPFEGQIEDVLVRPGDLVKAGDVLLQMRTDELETQLFEARARVLEKKQEADRLRREWQQRRASSGEVQQAERQMEAEQFRVQHLEKQLAKATVRAAIDGEVLAGDLRHKIGAPVKLGEELFTIADRSRLRAQLAVPERDIQDLYVGQTGKLRTNALPDRDFPFEIETIFPQADAKEGGNFFKVYAVMNGTTDASWRPGMQGEAAVDVEERRLIWIWTHRVIDFITLKFWL